MRHHDNLRDFFVGQTTLMVGRRPAMARHSSHGAMIKAGSVEKNRVTINVSLFKEFSFDSHLTQTCNSHREAVVLSDDESGWWPGALRLSCG
jgi:hypothetical protein